MVQHVRALLDDDHRVLLLVARVEHDAGPEDDLVAHGDEVELDAVEEVDVHARPDFRAEHAELGAEQLRVHVGLRRAAEEGVVHEAVQEPAAEAVGRVRRVARPGLEGPHEDLLREHREHEEGLALGDARDPDDGDGDDGDLAVGPRRRVDQGDEALARLERRERRAALEQKQERHADEILRDAQRGPPRPRRLRLERQDVVHGRLERGAADGRQPVQLVVVGHDAAGAEARPRLEARAGA